MNHKYKRPKTSRAGCLLCKPSKIQANVGTDRRRQRVAWLHYEYRAEHDDDDSVPRPIQALAKRTMW